MKYFLRLPLLFFRICWEQGIQKAVMLALGTLSRHTGITRKLSSLRPKFPPKSRSNAGSYLGLLKLKPMISIIMPVYNSRWLTQAVDSVLNQSYRHFELILVDDCSTSEETRKALENAQYE
ncbi:glycosyltransferase, partial [Verrucomicrobiota bacterium]